MSEILGTCDWLCTPHKFLVGCRGWKQLVPPVEEQLSPQPDVQYTHQRLRPDWVKELLDKLDEREEMLEVLSRYARVFDAICPIVAQDEDIPGQGPEPHRRNLLLEIMESQGKLLAALNEIDGRLKGIADGVGVAIGDLRKDLCERRCKLEPVRMDDETYELWRDLLGELRARPRTKSQKARRRSRA